MRKLPVPVGERFGALTVLDRGPRAGSAVTYLCRCDCGTIKPVRQSDMRRGKVSSCGCFRRQHSRELGYKNRRHGHAGNGKETGTYYSWRGMVRRCTDPRMKDFRKYGARGITVCKEWLLFDNFLADMGERPDGHSIDRIDSRFGYSKANCRWATMEMQLANRSWDNRRYYGA